MGKNRKQASLTNVVQYDSNFNLSIGSSTSSSFNSSGSIIAASGFTGSLSGSVFGLGNTVSFSSSVSSDLVNLESKSASVDISISNINSVTASNIARLSNLESKSSSVDISVSSLNTFTASNGNTSLNSKTGSYATTGSNSFYGTQVFSGSVYIANDLVVQGSSSIQYISASSVSIGTNIVNLNTATPSVRYAGISVQDSGSSAGITGSMLWDSLCNRWIYSNPSTIGYSGGLLMSGPRAATLGSEITLTCNYIAKSGGGDHLYDSCIIDDGTTVCVNANLKGSGTACFGSVTSGGNICTSYVSLSNSYPNITFLQNSIGNIVTTGTNDIAFRPNDVEKMRITNCGYVGIGTNCPTGYLNISTATPGQNEPHIRLTDSSAAGNGGNVYISADKTGVGYNNLTMLAFSYTFKGGGSATNYLTINTSGVSCFAGAVCAPNAVINCLGVNAVWSSGGGANQPLQVKSGVAGAGVWIESCSSDAGGYINMNGNCMTIGQSYRTSGGYNDILFQTAGNTRMTIRCTGIVDFACQVCAKSLTTASGGVTQISNGVKTQTFFAYKLINENSTTAFFRITTSGASSTHTQLVASNAGVGWHTSQIYHASNAGYWGGYIGSGASISITNGSAGYISGIYSDNAGAQNYCVTVASNGTSTQSLVVAYITVVLADGYTVQFTQL